MKNLYIIIIIGCAFILNGCDHFLTVQPRDMRIMKTVEDYRDLMGSYMRLLTNITNTNQQNVFGEAWLYPKFDVAFVSGLNCGETTLSNSQGSYYDKKEGLHTELGKQLLTWLYPNEDIWNRYYGFLGPINLIINGIADAKGNDENLRHIVQGEALVWRAYSYFKLLQYYSPYKENQLGIPVYLEPYEEIGTAMPPRLTQAEVYRQIIMDCRTSLDMMDITPSNNWNFAWKPDFIYAMMSSVYLYKAGSGAAETNDWQLAADYAEKAMLGRELTNDPADLKALFNGADVKDYRHDEAFIRLIDGTQGYLFDYREAYCSSKMTVDPVSGNYKTKYRDDDIRKPVYFTTEGDEFLADKYSLNETYLDGGGVLMPFRLAEMYLNRAEALVMTGQIGAGREILVAFRANRYREAIDTPSDKEQLLKAIHTERELEFFNENDFRWLDMKRLGIRIERTVDGEKQVLEPDDFRYSFPIPKEEIKLNRNIKQTPGWDKIIY